MFAITKMPDDGEQYLSAIAYYWGKGHRKEKGQPDDGHDDSPDGYPNASEPPVWWVGKGVVSLGLAGEIKEEQYRRIFRGFHPFTE
ncbi:MAG: relaxase domain-containing protein [Thermoguttaceae bacterium]